MIQYSDDMLSFAKENLSSTKYNDLLVTLEASDKDSFGVHTQFLKNVVSAIQKLLKQGKVREKVFSEVVVASKGDITKVEQVQITLDVLKSLQKSTTPGIKKDVSMLMSLYNEIKAHKNEFVKVYSVKKSGSPYESIMAGFVYKMYCASVQILVEATSLLLATIHNPSAKNPFFGTSALAHAAKVEKLYREGIMKKCINALTKKDRDTHESIEVAGLMALGAIFAFITLLLSLRILVYYFYYARMQLSDYFAEQAAFLDLHKSELHRDRSMSAREKDGIINSQKAWAERFMKLSEMIQDDDIAAAKKTAEVVRKENKSIIPEDGIQAPEQGMDFF